MNRGILAAALWGAALASGCVRDAEPERCPTAGAGDVVITELRGPQDGGDTWGQFVELANVTGVELDLEGAAIELVSVGGDQRDRVIIRRSLPVAPGGQVALGRFPDDARPAWIDYGMDLDLPRDLPATGGVTVTGCDDLLLDRVVYDALPDQGSYSLGLDPPSADGNDDDAAWCADTTPVDEPGQLGLPGTPGEINHPCVAP